VTAWGAVRAVAVAGVAAAVVLPVLVARRGARAAAAARAERTAWAAAGYLSRVAPRQAGGTGFDLARLHVAARRLAARLDPAARLEVYHGTAPLVAAGAPPLTVAELGALERREAAHWHGDRVRVPLKDPDQWDVVGVVEVGRERVGLWGRGGVRLGATALLTLAAGAAAAMALAAAPRRRTALAVFAAAVLAHGAAAGAAGRTALAVALALLGPAFVALAAWLARAARRPRALRETLTAWAFLTPAAVHLAVFSFGPILFALWLALHEWSPVEPVRPFVGLANVAAVARDPLTWISLRNTVLYALYVPVTMAIALGAAVVLDRAGPLARWVRTAFFLPYVSSVVAVSLVWQWMLHADFGLLNWLLSHVGLAGRDWLGDPRTALLAVMAVSVWVQLGYQMTVFHAGLQGIPSAYLDAARVDGATGWQRFWRVTLPLLKPVTLFVLVTGVIGSFQVFTYVYVLTDGGPLHATDVIVYRIYQTAWEFLRFGPASALALGLTVLLLGLTWAQFRLLGRTVEHG
jgi:ABC-type sugar transport system permease subunit